MTISWKSTEGIKHKNAKKSQQDQKHFSSSYKIEIWLFENYNQDKIWFVMHGKKHFKILNTIL